MLGRLLDILLPSGGYTLQMIEAYFDESGSHDASPVLCVAGYIFEKDPAILLDKEWLEALNRYEIPYFRMSQCASGAPPFDKFDKFQRRQIVIDMINIIKKYASCGIEVTVEQSMFDDIAPKAPEIGSSYTFCLDACVVGIKRWADKINYNGEIAYFFESGHKSSNEANRYMNNLFNIPQFRQDYRYASHVFADKKKVRPLQAADILAWQSFTDYKRKTIGKLSRQDFLFLKTGGKPPYRVLHINKKELRHLTNIYLHDKYPLTYIGK
jgi:hypothetical protein